MCDSNWKSSDSESSFSWRSKDPSIAQIDTLGRVSAIKSGTTIIEAFYGDSIVAASKLAVSNKKISGMELYPKDTSILLGNTINYQLVGTYSSAKKRKKSLAINEEKRRISNQYIKWQVADTNIATINKQGVLTPKKTGATTLFATYGRSEVSSTNLYVCSMDLQPEDTTIVKGDSIQYRLIGSFPPQKEGRNNVTKSATWSVSKANANFSSSTKGLLNTNAVGNTTISASYDGFQKNASLTILDSIISLSFPTDTSIIRMGQKYSYGDVGLNIRIQTLDSLVQFNSEDSIPGLSYRFESLGSGYAIHEKDSFKLVYGTMIRLVADYLGREDSVILKKIPYSGQFSISPNGINNTFVAANDTIQLQITVNGENYNEDIAYSSSNPRVASVDKNGQIITRKTGKAIIYMNTTGWSDAIILYVADLKEIVLSSTTPIAVNQTEQINAWGIGIEGDSLLMNWYVNWHLSDSSVLSINNDGTAKASKVGRTNVSASYSGKHSDTITIQTTNNLIGIRVAASQDTLIPLKESKLKVIGQYQSGQLKDLTDSVQWSISNPLAAAISINYKIIALRVGSSMIKASYLGFSDSLSIQVEKSIVDSIFIVSRDTFIHIGSSQNRSFQCEGLYVYGKRNRSITDSVEWSVSDTTIATIDSAGNLSPLKIGEVTIFAQFIRYHDTLTTSLKVHIQKPSLEVKKAVKLLIGSTGKFVPFQVYPERTFHYQGKEITRPVTNVCDVDYVPLTNQSCGYLFSHHCPKNCKPRIQYLCFGCTIDNSITKVKTVYDADTSNIFKVVALSEPIQLDTAFSSINMTVQDTISVRLDAPIYLNNLLSWVSSDTAVATVDSTGFIRATGEGKATIQLTLDTWTDSIKVNVSD